MKLNEVRGIYLVVIGLLLTVYLLVGEQIEVFVKLFVVLLKIF